MARLTKNSYKRKIIVFGLLVFMSIALISTGFAAWIMSQEAKVENEGNVSVGVVDDSRITFENLKYDLVIVDYEGNELSGDAYSNATQAGLNFLFEPRHGDSTGNIQWDKNDTNCEIMKLHVSGYITNLTLLKDGKFTVNLVVTEGVHNCLTKNFIQLKDFANPVKDDQTGLYTYTREIAPASNGTFDYYVEFVWGSVFNGENPAKSTDAEGITNDELDVIKKNLEEFRAYLLGYYEDHLGANDQPVKGLKYYNSEISRLETLIHTPNPEDADNGLTVDDKLAKIATLRANKEDLIKNANDTNKYQLVMIAING